MCLKSHQATRGCSNSSELLYFLPSYYMTYGTNVCELQKKIGLKHLPCGVIMWLFGFQFAVQDVKLIHLVGLFLFLDHLMPHPQRMSP